jgi:hypothetical protein
MLTQFRLPLVTRLVIYSVLVSVAVATSRSYCAYRTEYHKR